VTAFPLLGIGLSNSQSLKVGSTTIEGSQQNMVSLKKLVFVSLQKLDRFVISVAIFGSRKTEVAALRRDVCFAPVSGHRQAISACPKSAKLRHCERKPHKKKPPEGDSSIQPR
jgi:hypothetical protein